MSKWQTSSEFFNRFVKSSWHSRNDSSNISGVLKTKQHRISKTLSYGEDRGSDGMQVPLLVSNECYTIYSNRAKHSCSNCYCNKSPVAPALAKKLDLKYEYKLNPSRRKMLHRINKYNGYVYNSARERYVPCDFLKNLMSVEPRPDECCLHEDLASLEFTTPRQVYEEFKAPKGFENEYRDILQSCRDKLNSLRSLETAQKSVQVDDIIEEEPLSFRPCCTQRTDEILKIPTTCDKSTTTNAKMDHLRNITFLDSNTDTNLNLQKLNTFRKENYFDCHSIPPKNDLKIPDHKCVHKFILDERLIPQPLNADPFGQSSCAICQKIIEPGIPRVQDSNTQLKITVSNTQIAAGDVNKMEAKVDPKLPKNVKVMNKANKIEITVPLYLNNNFKINKPDKNVSPAPPVNSLALRHQKGVVNK